MLFQKENVRFCSKKRVCVFSKKFYFLKKIFVVTEECVVFVQKKTKRACFYKKKVFVFFKKKTVCFCEKMCVCLCFCEKGCVFL